MSKEISPSLLSREMVKSAASLQRDSGEKTQQKRTQLETQGSSARLFSHGWHSSSLPFFLHEVSHDPGWLQLPLEPLTVPPLPHQACTALTFNPWPHWLSTRSLSVSYQVSKWFTSAVPSSRFLYTLIICIQLTGDTMGTLQKVPSYLKI